MKLQAIFVQLMTTSCEIFNLDNKIFLLPVYIQVSRRYLHAVVCSMWQVGPLGTEKYPIGEHSISKAFCVRG